MTQAAQQLDVSRVTLSRVLNGRAAISPEMALRIEAWLGVKRGGEARLWLAEQSAYDVWQAEQEFKAAPMRVKPAPLDRLSKDSKRFCKGKTKRPHFFELCGLQCGARGRNRTGTPFGGGF